MAYDSILGVDETFGHDTNHVETVLTVPTKYRLWSSAKACDPAELMITSAKAFNCAADSFRI